MKPHFLIVCLLFAANSSLFAAEFNWVSISEETQINVLIEAEVRRLFQDQKIITFEATTEVFEQWIRNKQEFSEKWQSHFEASRVALQQSFHQMSDEMAQYVTLSNTLEIEAISLNAARKRIQTLEGRIHSLQSERKTILQNFQAQLKNMGWQILLKGSLKQSFASELPPDQVKRLMTQAINIEAIRLMNQEMLEFKREIRNHEVLQEQMSRRTQGRAETTSTYPIDVSGYWKKAEKLQGPVDHLFHVVTVYPFQVNSKTQIQTSHTSQNPTLLNWEIQALNTQNLNQILESNSDFKDNNIRKFLENWLKLMERNNLKTASKLKSIRASFQNSLQALEKRLQSFKEERRKKRCEVVQKQQKIHGSSEYPEWTSSCDSANKNVEKITNLQQQQKDWELKVWPEVAQDFQQKQEEYAQNYQSKIIALDRVGDSKRKGNERTQDTWIRVAQSAFSALNKEVASQSYQEDILIIDQELKEYNSKTIEYKAIPVAFSILYLASHQSGGQSVQIAGIAVKVQLQSQTQQTTKFTLELPQVKSAFQCTLERLKALFHLKIPLEVISKRCLIRVQ